MRLTAQERARKKDKKEARQARISERNQALASRPPSEDAIMATPSRYARLGFYDCRIDEAIFANGMGTVVVARSLRADRVVMATFLVDTYCLGVKDTFVRRESVDSYRLALRHFGGAGSLRVVTPEYACKLVTSAVEYARGLGFAPHADYAQTSEIFAGVDPDLCETPISLGHDGKPHYMSGPHEDARRITEIIDTLTRTVGEENFHFTIRNDPRA